jgi:hypothetical protein
MAKNVQFELNIDGLRELMKSEWMQEHLMTAGKAVARSSGKDYKADVHTASYVAIANVYPNSKKAAKENHNKNTLLKGISAAGLPMEKPKL